MTDAVIITTLIVALAAIALAGIAYNAWLRALADRRDARQVQASETAARLVLLEARVDAQAKEIAAAAKRASDAMSKRVRA